VKELQTDEEESRLRSHHPSFVHRLFRAENGEVDEREPGVETRAPDHVGGIHGATVFELRESILDTRDPRTRCTPAAARSLGLTRIKGSPVEIILGRTFLPTGVLVVSTR
jgi:hypothetical protein